MKDYFYSNLNLNNMLDHIQEIQNLKCEKFGQYRTQQRGSYRIYMQGENMYIKSMIETSEDVWEKLEIFDNKDIVIKKYLDFLSLYQLDYNRYLNK